MECWLHRECWLHDCIGKLYIESVNPFWVDHLRKHGRRIEVLHAMSMQVEKLEGGLTERSSSAEQPMPSARKRINWGLLLVCITCVAIGTIGGPLLQRLYFVHGGSRKWLSGCLQTIGFPFTLFPLSLLYLRSPAGVRRSQSFFITRRLFLAGVVLGLVLGFGNYMFAVGLYDIPVSTSSLLFSTQLGFTAIFAFLIVKQRFTFYSTNAVIVMTLGAIVLALHTSSDRPPGVSNARYFEGFFFTLGGAALLGFTLPCFELSYMKAGQVVTCAVVMQFQVVVALFATLFSATGMAVNNDFQAIPREAREYGLGKVKYYVVLVATALLAQILYVGILGLVYCSSSLFSGIVCAFLLPFTQAAAVVVFGEKFTGEKGMSLALCLWGFASYFIGEYRMSKKMNPLPGTELEPVANHIAV
ncbi:hypothetical protein ACLOJK_016403 [Asimina triloba]